MMDGWNKKIMPRKDRADKTPCTNTPCSPIERITKFKPRLFELDFNLLRKIKPFSIQYSFKSL